MLKALPKFRAAFVLEKATQGPRSAAEYAGLRTAVRRSGYEIRSAVEESGGYRAEIPGTEIYWVTHDPQVSLHACLEECRSALALKKAEEAPRTPEEYDALRIAAALAGYTIVVEWDALRAGMVWVALEGTDIYWNVEATKPELGVWACLEEFFWEEHDA